MSQSSALPGELGTDVRAQDPELWDPSGDTLVYFGQNRPEASMRIRSAYMEETESVFFGSILREGYKYRNDFNDKYKGDFPFNSSGSPISPPPSSSSASLGPSSTVRSSMSTARDSNSNFSSRRRPKVFSALSGLKKTGQPTPPLSETSTVEEVPVLYEIYFPPPTDGTKMEILRHHITTRNVFALLCNKAIVGLSFYQALIDLLERLQMYLPLETDCASLMIDYLTSNGLSDIRNDPASAAGLLAWSEEPTVRWAEGWREAFVHCVGMYNKVTSATEFADISLVSRALLERSHLELQVRVQSAEDRLANFHFDDVWPVQSAQPPAARTSFDRFRRFLKQFYENAYKNWPVRGAGQDNESTWLTRALVMRLQQDLGCIYDHFVDRDITWSEPEEGSNNRRKMISKSQRTTFRADSEDVRMTDMFLGFDNKIRASHIPFPYPLLPTSVPAQYSSGKKAGFFGGSKARGAEKRVALAYSEASNAFVIGGNFVQNDLVDAFLRFEKTDQAGEVDPYDARKGRWILLYCALQSLANVSVDTPGIWFKDGCQYFLNPGLKGTPPWTSHANISFPEATRERSHCWKVPSTWVDNHQFGWTGLRNHRQIVITSDGIGDGIGRDPPPQTDERTAVMAKVARARNVNHGEKTDEGYGNVDVAADRTFLDDSEIRPRTSFKVRDSVEGKSKDWPIKGSEQNYGQGLVGSDYVPPQEW